MHTPWEQQKERRFEKGQQAHQAQVFSSQQQFQPPKHF